MRLISSSERPLEAAAAGIAQQAYAAAGGQPGPEGGAGAGAASGGAEGHKDDIVDAEFEEVKDKKA
jgi:molecular chaperone DnaK